MRVGLKRGLLRELLWEPSGIRESVVLVILCGYSCCVIKPERVKGARVPLRLTQNIHGNLSSLRLFQIYLVLFDIDLFI